MARVSVPLMSPEEAGVWVLEDMFDRKINGPSEAKDCSRLLVNSSQSREGRELHRKSHLAEKSSPSFCNSCHG